MPLTVHAALGGVATGIASPHLRVMRIMDVEQIEPAARSGLTDRLLPDERVEEAFKATATMVLFTDRRIVTIQRHTLLSERVETSSFSYRAVRQFAVLEGDPQESRSEIKIWIGADPQPLHLRANGATDLGPLQLLLASKLR
jgi:hypothetical protein